MKRIEKYKHRNEQPKPVAVIRSYPLVLDQKNPNYLSRRNLIGKTSVDFDVNDRIYVESYHFNSNCNNTGVAYTSGKGL